MTKPEPSQRTVQEVVEELISRHLRDGVMTREGLVACLLEMYEVGLRVGLGETPPLADDDN